MLQGTLPASGTIAEQIALRRRSLTGRGVPFWWLQIDPRLVFAAASIVAACAILVLTSGLSFQGDEWAYIVDRRLTLESMVQPHNEHLAFLHVLVYRGLVELVGTSTYLPYLVLLMLTHVAMAAGVYALLRAVVPESAAVAGAVVILFLGSGFDNLVWAFQIGFVGSAALGVWAMAIGHPWRAALLLTASLWTQGVGLFFIAPVALLLRRRAWVLAVPIATYAAWMLLVGRESVPYPAPGPFLEYAVRLIGSVVGGLAGVGPGVGLAVLAVVALRLGWRRPSSFVVAGAAGLASLVLLLAFGRAHFGPDQAEAPRYIYVAAPFVLMVLTGVQAHRRVWIAAFATALTLNVYALPRGIAIYHAFLDYDRSIPIEERLAPFRPEGAHDAPEQGGVSVYAVAAAISEGRTARDPSS